MPSPLVKLMTYGGTPINRQADRFLTHKSRKRHKKKKKGIKTTPKVKTQRPRRLCPICGKWKIGLEAHMSAKHRGATIPKPAVSLVKPIIGEKFPNLSFVLQAPIPQPAKAGDTQKPVREVQRQTSSPAITRRAPKTTGKKRRCPVCAAQYNRLSQHIAQAHDQVFIECPSCYAEIIVKGAGKRRCCECRKVFTIGAKGKAVGIRAECPDCFNDFYTEKLGLIACPTCKMKTFFDGKGKPC